MTTAFHAGLVIVIYKFGFKRVCHALCCCCCKSREEVATQNNATSVSEPAAAPDNTIAGVSPLQPVPGTDPADDIVQLPSGKIISLGPATDFGKINCTDVHQAFLIC